MDRSSRWRSRSASSPTGPCIRHLLHRIQPALDRLPDRRVGLRLQPRLSI